MSKKGKRSFKVKITEYGYSDETADNLWKWYNFDNKLNAFSF